MCVCGKPKIPADYKWTCRELAPPTLRVINLFPGCGAKRVTEMTNVFLSNQSNLPSPSIKYCQIPPPPHLFHKSTTRTPGLLCTTHNAHYLTISHLTTLEMEVLLRV